MLSVWSWLRARVQRAAIRRKLDAITKTLLVDTPLATSVRYSFSTSSSQVGADTVPLKVHDGVWDVG